MEVTHIGDEDRSTLMTFSDSALRAPDHTEHFVDIERDHAFDLSEGCRTPWRTCQPFKGFCTHSQQARACCEGPAARIEAG